MMVRRCAARAVLLVAVAFGALSATSAAPVPKTKPREGTIVMLSGYGGAPRLYRADGTYLGELPFKSVWGCALSPDGTRAAVIVRSNELNNLPVYVVHIGSDKIGEPLAFVGKHGSVAWGGNEKVYVTEFREPLPIWRASLFRPERVTVCDLSRATATEDKALHGYSVCGLSPNGKQLLAQRYVAEPVERWETVLLDVATGKLNADLGELNSPRFYGADGILGSRTPKDAKAEEYVVYDLASKRAGPLKLPKEVTAGTARVMRVLPSPDGTRLLYVWTEEVPLPADWPVGLPGPLRAARMTTCDRDGGNARTIFKPEIKTREDETRYHFGGTIDWR